MRITVLTALPNSYSVRRLKEAGAKLDLRVRTVSPVDCAVSMARDRPLLYHKGKKMQLPDAVLPRIAVKLTFFGVTVLRQFEQQGVFTVNTSHSVLASRDKLRALQILGRHRIGIPETEVVSTGADVVPSIERLGGAPVVIKTIEGTQGAGVLLAESRATATAIVNALHGAHQNVLIQRFVSESRGRDVRALVVGSRVVAAMRRIASGDDFRSNVHLGATTEPVSLDPDTERVAVRAAQVLGLRVAGVDLLESDQGPLVMEVNSSPGLEGIEGATGVDVAAEILQHTVDHVHFLEVDVKQEPDAANYGLVDLAVGDVLKGAAIRETVLFEQNVQFLRLKRGEQTWPTPSVDTRLERHDELLCYGPLALLKSLIPPKKPKKKI